MGSQILPTNANLYSSKDISERTGDLFKFLFNKDESKRTGWIYRLDDYPINYYDFTR